MKLKSVLFGGAEIKSGAANFGLLIVRGFAGAALCLAHGINGVPPSRDLVDGVGEMGFPMPIFFAWFAALAESLAAAMMAVGFMTRWAAFAVACTMGTAGFVAHGGDPFSKAEMAFLYLSISLAVMFIGGGRFSIDGKLRK
ncbi:DoxX family protein [bacterium]|nr:DoxX family protein [bacterium]